MNMKQKEDRKERIQNRIAELDQQIPLLEFEREFWKDILENKPTDKGPLNLELIEKFKGMYERYKEVIEYKIRSGSDFEKVEASFVKQVALGEIK